jgi:hypothetical protein
MSNVLFTNGGGSGLGSMSGSFSEPPLSPPTIGGPPPGVPASQHQAAQSPQPDPVQAPEPAAEPALAAVQSQRPLGQEDFAKLPLQALLVRGAYVTVDQLSRAVSESIVSGRSVEEIVVHHGWVSEADVNALQQAKANATGATVAAVQPTTADEALAAVQPVATDGPVAAVQPVATDEAVAAVQPVAPAPEPVAPAPVPAPAPAEPAPPAAPPEPPPPAAAPLQPPLQPPLVVAPTPPVVAVQPPPIAPAPPPVAHIGSAGEADETEAADETTGVFLHLTSGERLWIDRFASLQQAEQRAQELIDQLIRPEPGVWPRFGGRYIRPDSVVSIELSRRQDD